MTSEFKLWTGTYISISFHHLNNPSGKKERVKVPFIMVKSIHFSGETQMNGVWVLRGIWVVVYLLYYPFLFCYYYQYQDNTSLQSF